MQVMDEFTEYEKGLKLLYQKFDKDQPEIINLHNFESQLNENIRSARINGDSQNNKSDRSRILNQLNLLSLKFTQCSFNEFCRQAICEEDRSKKEEKFETFATVKTAPDEFDVFLCYNSEDRTIIEEIGRKLKEIGLNPWFDEWELRPGLPWQELLEKQIENIKSVAVFVGKNGIGPWQNRESKSFIRQFDKRKCPVIPVILPDCKSEPKLPPFLEGFTWVDFRREDTDPLVKLKWGITGDSSIKTFEKTAEENSNEQNQREYRTVIPIGVDLPIIEPPGHLILPPGYLYLGKLDGLDVDHFYREKDGHVVLYFPQITENTKPFLIDKYAITATQFCNCLNELLDKDIIKIEKYPTFSCNDKQEKPIVFDAQEQWRRGNTNRQPWLHAAKPWGISYQSGGWQPAPGSELLPVTNITWWGARLYSLWCHDRLEAKTREHTTYLPTVIQWQEAAQLEISGRRRRYPWGDTWRREWVNHAGYWADREVREENWVENWATRENIYQNTRPLPVANINDGRSAIGCVQMLGNVWEWCSDNFTGESSLDKTVIGGACLSPQEYCSPGWKTKWRSGHGSEYIGFRCCFPLNK